MHPFSRVLTLVIYQRNEASLSPNAACEAPQRLIEMQRKSCRTCDSRQQLGAVACRPLGGVISSLSLHPTGQCGRNRSLGKRGNQLPLKQTPDTPRWRQQLVLSEKRGMTAISVMLPGIGWEFIYFRELLKALMTAWLNYPANGPNSEAAKWGNSTEWQYSQPPPCYGCMHHPVPVLVEVLYNWPNGLHMEER